MPITPHIFDSVMIVKALGDDAQHLKVITTVSNVRGGTGIILLPFLRVEMGPKESFEI